MTRCRRHTLGAIEGPPPDAATVARHPFYDGLFRHAQAVGAWRSAWEFA